MDHILQSSTCYFHSRQKLWMLSLKYFDYHTSANTSKYINSDSCLKFFPSFASIQQMHFHSFDLASKRKPFSCLFFRLTEVRTFYFDVGGSTDDMRKNTIYEYVFLHENFTISNREKFLKFCLRPWNDFFLFSHSLIEQNDLSYILILWS